MLTKKALVTPVNTEGDRTLYQIGSPLEFNLLNDFSGLNYMYFGNFTALRREVIIWRVNMLTEILDGRRATFDTRVKAGIATAAQAQLLDETLSRLQIWIVVTTSEDKAAVVAALGTSAYQVEVFSIADVSSVLEKLGKAEA